MQSQNEDPINADASAACATGSGSMLPEQTGGASDAPGASSPDRVLESHGQ